MGSLQTFDDRTIQRAREKFTNGKRGSGDDPIATHSKVAQDVLLGNLEKLISRAEGKADRSDLALKGELDGESLIDPFISYDENVGIIQDRYNVEFESYARKKQKEREKDADERARRHAREWIIEKTRDIAGSADPAEVFRSALEGDTENDELELAINELRDEFEETLLADALTGLETPITEQGAPEPTPVDEPETPAGPVDEGPAPEPVDEITPENEPAPIEISADPVDETPPAEPTEPETPNTRDYSGILGFGRLVVDSILANYEQGKRESMTTDSNNQQTTLEAY